MLHRLARAYVGLGWPAGLALAIGVPVLTFLFGVAIAVWLPADYFVRQRRAPARHPAIHFFLRILRNLVGWVMILLGIFMALPLVPGPGLVFILIGVSLADFPGKRRLEERLLGYAPVLQAVNRMRQRFGRPAVQVHPHRRARSAPPKKHADP
jgi:hypothetical protein